MRIAPLIACCSLIAACSHDRIADTDEAYFQWNDDRVLCAAGFDDVRGNDLDSIVEGLARASARGEVLILFGHKPGRDFPVALVDDMLTAADDAGVPLLSFEDLQQPGGNGPGLALTFDDAHVAEWHALRDVLSAHDARVTFFVTRFANLSPTNVARLQDLRADGHAIEAHGANHLDAAAYTERHGLDAWVVDELRPSIDDLRAAGFAPSSFAYPFGTRTRSIDAAALDHVGLVRSITFTEPSPPVSDPCPH